MPSSSDQNGQQHQDLKDSIASMITGVESPVPQANIDSVEHANGEASAGASSSASGSGSGSASSAPTTLDDDITPFPSPMLSATSLAGLSCEFARVRYECHEV